MFLASRMTVFWTALMISHLSWIDSEEPSINNAPIAVVYTPNSVLQTSLSDSYLRYIGEKHRFSTCGGVCWFSGNRYLFAVNMQTSSVQIYEFFEGTKTLVPLKIFTNENGIDLTRPEGICISKDGALIAIPNMSSGKLQIYATDEQEFMHPIPLVTIQSYKLHGARFSPDTRFISYTGFGQKSWIYTSRLIQKNGQWECIPVQKMENQFEPLRPKSLDFSPDGRFAVIGYCKELSKQQGAPSVGLLATFHRDPETGLIDSSPISCIEGLSSVETIMLSPNARYILATDQANNQISGHELNPETGELIKSWVVLKNPEAQLSFCHGLAISPDGKYIAVSNYGDDKVTLYSVEVD